MRLAKKILNWPEFDAVCDLTLAKVVPRLLLPLQSEGRTLKPCLMHGDCWDGNTAMDKGPMRRSYSMSAHFTGIVSTVS